MSFCTAINCMDGRAQEPVLGYLKKRFGVRYVDTITEPGPNRILATGEPPDRAASILERCDLSVRKHGSRGIAVVGHHDCAGNPADGVAQAEHLRQAVARLRRHYPDLEVIALWLDESFRVHEPGGERWNPGGVP